MSVRMMAQGRKPAGGGGTPTLPYTTGLKLHLDANAITGLSDSDPVATWSDESGLGNDYAQASSTVRPTYRTGVLNGLPVVRFDNGNDQLVGGLTVAQPTTVIVVFQVRETGSWAVFGGSQFLYGDTLGASRMHGGADMAVGSGITQSTWYTFACRFNAASSKGNRSDSATTSTGSASGNAWNSPGSQYVGGGQTRWGSDIAELLIYDHSVSGANIDAIGDYLADKWGVTWTGGAT